MEKVNILDARNSLSRLVAAASEGHEIVIANRGRPVARLIAIDANEQTHTAQQAADWLVRNPVPPRIARASSALDEQIATEREGWE